MKLEKQDDEFEMLLDEIPHATSLPLHNHYEHEQHHHHLSMLNDSEQEQNHLHYRREHGHQHNHHVHYANGGHVNSGHGHSMSPTLAKFGMYDHDPSCHPGYVCVSPVSGVSLQSEGSSSSSLSGCDGSPSPPPTKYQMQPRKSHNQDGFWLSRESELVNSPVGKNVNGSEVDELSNRLGKMLVRAEEGDAIRFEKLVPLENSINPYGFQLRSSAGVNHGNVVTNSAFVEGVTSSPFLQGKNVLSNDCDLIPWLGVPNSAAFDEERRLQMSGVLQRRAGNLSGLGLPQQCHMRNFGGSFLPPNQLDTPFPYLGPYTDLMNPKQRDEVLSNLQLYGDACYGTSCYNSRIHVPNTVPSINRASVTDNLFISQQKGIDSDGDWVGLSLLSSPHATLPKVSSDVGTPLHCSLQNGWAPQSPSSTRHPPNLEAFCCEDSFIIQGRKDLNYVVNDGHNHLREHRRCSHNDMSRGHSREKNHEMDIRLSSTEIGRSPRVHVPPLLPLKYNSVMEIQGYIYFIANDQHGCRFLQKKFDEGTPQEVQMIFNEIIDHVIELMMHPFGNYLMQKLLDVCTEEQRLQILFVVTEVPRELVRISLNTHGTRVVQKLIETLKTRQQISLVVSALEPGFLDLIKDLNGNHVVQRCLQCLSNEDNKFIFVSAAKHCFDIATHRHGCCVLQRCITHSTGKYRENLVAEISANGLLLAQDAFGNYVVQYILELKIPSATAKLISQFEGNYIHLSSNKFSSNVVEKCLKLFGEESRSRIIYELLSTSRFECLLQDPFANYVIQSALLVSKGLLHASLVEAIRPHSAIMRTSPYCKRIFSRALLKK